MEQRPSSALKVVVGVLAVLLVLAIGVPLALNVLNTDYSRSPISLSDFDAGVRVVLEPGDEFDVGLMGHPDHPSAAWDITALDASVVEIRGSRHEPSGTGVPEDDDLAMIGADRQTWYATVREGPPDVEEPGEPGGGIWFVSLSGFDLAGAGYGDSAVRLEIEAAGETAAFEFEVSVVADACRYFGEPNTMVPHRCG
ncbi:MAG: hypothetical protein KQH83_06985 [Actinobacteria bacterium]|nr:hypothetical protein [Actinomycetota bacterium]